MLDLAIVGAGPCGLACAAAARQAGLSCTVFDRGSLVHTLARFPVGMRFFSTADRLAIAGIPFIAPEPNPTREQVLAYYRAVASRLDLPVELYTEVTGIAREGEGFALELRSTRVPGRTGRVRARAVVLATGAYDTPHRLGVPGEDLPHVSHYFTEAHAYWGQRVVVVGGRNSAVEAAIALARAGARVTLVHRGPDVSDRVKPWVLPFFRSLQREGAIETVFGATVERIESDAVWVRDGEGTRRCLPAQFVLLLTGYAPEDGLLRLLGARLHPESGAPVLDEHMQTSVPGVYVCGVLAAGRRSGEIFIENGRFHGLKVVRHLLLRRGLPEREVAARLPGLEQADAAVPAG